MPKASRTRNSVHQSSVKLPKRTFAVQQNVVERVEVGSAPEASASELLKSLGVVGNEILKPTINKKEKQAIKREAFLQKLDVTRSAFSKSHQRRLKRKEREQIANGMSDMQQALAAIQEPLDTSEPVEPTKKGRNTMDTDPAATTSRPTATSKSLRIGEGKGVTLTKAQRKRALDLERLRQPMILTNSTFADNPFSTIRTHAQNTLVKHQPSA